MRAVIISLAIVLLASASVLASPATAEDSDTTPPSSSSTTTTTAAASARSVGTTLATISDAELLSPHRAYVGSDGVRLSCGNSLTASQSVDAAPTPTAQVSDWTEGYWTAKLRLACPVVVAAEGRVIASLADSDTTPADTTLEHQVSIRVVVEFGCVSGTTSGEGESAATSYSLALRDTKAYAAGTDYLAELAALCEPPAPPIPPLPDVSDCDSAVGSLAEFHRCNRGHNNQVGWIINCGRLVSGLWTPREGADKHLRFSYVAGDGYHNLADVRARAEAAAASQCARKI